MVRKQKELDITKTGPVGYRSLQAQNNAQFDEVDRFINESQNRILSRASQSDPYRDTQQMVKSPLAGTGTSWGESMWDNKSALDPAQAKTIMSDSHLEISLMLKKNY